MKRIAGKLAVLVLALTAIVVPASPAAATCGYPFEVGQAPSTSGRGWYICGWLPTQVERPNGVHQWFLVGTDYRIYTSYEYSAYSNQYTPWKSLGGQATSNVEVYAVNWDEVELYVEGTWGGGWCNWIYTNQTASGWWNCAPH